MNSADWEYETLVGVGGADTDGCGETPAAV